MTHPIDLLEQSFDKAKCDKSSRHQYHRVYYPVIKEQMKKAEKKHGRPFRLLEIGIFKGASFEALTDFFENELNFTNYELYGIDIFTRLDPEEVPVLNHERVHWYQGDSTKSDQVPNGLPNFDIIIDDGLHTPQGQTQTFENYFSFLERGGSYFIEDVWPLHLMNPQQRKHKWLQKHPHQYTDVLHKELMNAINHQATFIMEHDHRELTGNADSFMFEIVKE